MSYKNSISKSRKGPLTDGKDNPPQSMLDASFILSGQCHVQIKTQYHIQYAIQISRKLYFLEAGNKVQFPDLNFFIYLYGINK